MTGNRRLELRETDTERDLINPDLDYGEVVHILGNLIDTEIVCTRVGLDEIGIDLPPGNQGNAETIHILGKIKLGTCSL